MYSKVKSPLKWHGGKSYIATKLVAMCPSHLHYVEPYAGGLSVLLAKDPEGVSEVVNDLSETLMNFWNVLRDESTFGSFVRLVSATPFSEQAWNESAPATRTGSIVRAVQFFVRCRQSLAGRMDTFTPLSRNRVRSGMNEQVSAWLSAVEGLPAVHARLKRVVILNRDALDVIRQQDGPQTLFYLDPPYLHETRAATDTYEHEMTFEQHRELLNVLKDLEGKFMLSGYRSTLYDDCSESYLWHRTDFDLPNNASGGDRKRRMTESVWSNFEPVNG